MNSYSLAADSRRWWWLPAAAGAIGATAVTAILVVPTTGASTPTQPLDPTNGDVGVVGTVTVVERPCYLARPGWNTVRGWAQPVCTTRVGPREDAEAPHVRRPAPDYLP